MATWRFKSFGLEVDFDHSEITQIITYMKTGSVSAVALGGFLVVIGIAAGPPAGIPALVSSLLSLGAMSLDRCNSNSKGIRLTVFWLGLRYKCTPL